jgi:amidase
MKKRPVPRKKRVRKTLNRKPSHPSFDPNFGTAIDAARAIRTGAISSQELVRHAFERIKKFNPKVNAFITLLKDQALKRAKEADQARARKKPMGPLHGVPISVKDNYATAGIRTTAGSKLLEKYIPAENAVAVDRLEKAGAILIGKTNLPEFALDHQSYNDIIGTTNNPWDDTKTSGGSSGGGTAALAAGFSFLELGNDIGGSIRNPCHFCGVYGHNPTLDVVARDGMVVSPNPKMIPLMVRSLTVAGPMARSAKDLRLEMEIIGGPSLPESVAYEWNLPPARRKSLKEYNVGYVLDDPFSALIPEVGKVHQEAIEALRKAGVRLTEGWPEGFSFEAAFENYLFLLYSHRAVSTTEQEIQELEQGVDGISGYWPRKRLEATRSSYKDWSLRTAASLRARFLWQQYFKTHDAFIMPANFTTAFPHDHQLPIYARMIKTPSGPRQYHNMLKWISVSTFTGCPTTAAPIGQTKSGMPVGVQIMGPFLEDSTPLDLADRMKDVIGGFTPPPGF